MEGLEKKLRDIIKSHARREPLEFDNKDDLLTQTGLDSLAGLELLATIEKKFSIKFPDDRLTEFRSLDAILNELNSQLKK